MMKRSRRTLKGPLGSRRRRLLATGAILTLLTAAVLAVQTAEGASAGRRAANESQSNERHVLAARSHREAAPSVHKAHKTAAAAGASCTDACTPADQAALDAAAEDAQNVAGSSYYTGAVVNTDLNTVTIYLAAAPQSVIDQLDASHPGTYVIHNDAPATLSTLRQLENSIDVFSLRSQGIDIVSIGPTSDGYLNVGVSSDVATAQAKLDSMYGSGVVQVTRTDPISFLNFG